MLGRAGGARDGGRRVILLGGELESGFGRVYGYVWNSVSMRVQNAFVC